MAGAESDEAHDLSERQRAVLRIEEAVWPSRYARERAVREQLGLSLVRYHQVLVGLLSAPAAWAVAPAVLASVRRRLQAAGQGTVGEGAWGEAE